MNYTQTVQKYLDAGLLCLPTKENKAPNSTAGWKDGFPPEAFTDCYGIGIICGEKSGGLECLDFDNHAGDAKENLSAYLAMPEVKEIYEKYELPIEQTMSGGYHLLFRCDKNEGNRKLASKMHNGKPDCFIETRGLGGYFCADPTPKYKLICNNILIISRISILERAILIDNAIAQNQVFPTLLRSDYENQDRPGDIYNSHPSSIGEMKSILTTADWVDLGNMNWRRPGKKEGVSATLGKVAPNVLYVFSSNASPFENNRAYTPFQVMALLKFNGDFTAAAKSLVPEKDISTISKKGELPVSEVEKFLKLSMIDTRRQIEKPPTILSITENTASRYEDKRVFTLGNFSCIIGKAKSKKTFLISLFTAALLNENSGVLVGSLPDYKNQILYFDTEQGEYDSYNVIRRIEKMSHSTSRLKAFNLRPFSPNRAMPDH